MQCNVTEAIVAHDFEFITIGRTAAGWQVSTRTERNAGWNVSIAPTLEQAFEKAFAPREPADTAPAPASAQIDLFGGLFS